MAEFCNEHNHNREAPNLQNRMCDYRSTWEVIKNSTDFENDLPLTTSSIITPPSFSLLQKRDRVICLVLDVSKTIAGVNSSSDILDCTLYFFCLMFSELYSSRNSFHADRETWLEM